MSDDGRPNRQREAEVPEEEVLEVDAAHPEHGIFAKAKPLGRTFVSFYHRDFAYMWTGSLLSNVGTWMQTVALSWVVFVLTKSAFALGVVNFLNSLPVFFFVLYAGAVADRTDRRSLLLATQAFLLVVALALGLLTTLRRLNNFCIYALTLATGLGTAFAFPAWQAMIPDLVPREDLMNAIALNSAQFNGARMIGPAVAGLLLARYGAAINFYANAASFLTVIVALLLIRPARAPHMKVESGWLHFTEGLRYARNHFSIALLLIYIGILTIFGMPFVVLLPIYSNEILRVGAGGYGFLTAASGVGSLAGALTTASIAHLADRGRILKWSIALFGVFLFLFSQSGAFYLSLVLLIGVGWSLLASTSTINTMIQEAVPDYIRGRVMSIYVWMFLGLMPFGSLAAGTIAHVAGPKIPLMLGGIILLAASGLILIKPDFLKRF